MKFNFQNTAVVLFVYNRPDHTERVLAGLMATGIKKLHVFQDGLKSGADSSAHERVAGLIKGIDFCDVVLRTSEKNMGLAKSIITGVTSLLTEFEAILVLEDDCVPSSCLIDYIYFCLSRYETDRNVFSISGFGLPSFPKNYAYDACFSPLPSSWGWATWRDRWQEFDVDAKGWQDLLESPSERSQFNLPGTLFTDLFERQMRGQVDSWAIRWYFAHFKAKATCIWPIKSLIQNIGMDGTGVHCGKTDAFDVELNQSFESSQFRFPPTFEFDREIQKAFHKNYGSPSPKRLFEMAKHPSNWPRLAKRIIEKLRTKFSF